MFDTRAAQDSLLAWLAIAVAALRSAAQPQQQRAAGAGAARASDHVVFPRLRAIGEEHLSAQDREA